MSVLRERVTVVWLGLIVATCVTTWGLSKELFSPAVAVVGIFTIAAVKVSYVMLDFMELRRHRSRYVSPSRLGQWPWRR